MKTKTKKEPKLRLKADFKELTKYLSLPTFSDEFKKGDVIELVDKKLGINRKCRIVKVEPKGIETCCGKKYYKCFNSVIILTKTK